MAFALKPEVAAKYNFPANNLKGQKLVFLKTNIHGVDNKPAHELTLEEVDKLYAAGCVTGLFTLKTGTGNGAATNETNDTTETKKKKNGNGGS